MEQNTQIRGGGKATSSKRSSMACTSCRQVKLRCDAMKCFPAPCTRCQKQRMSCKFDPKFKRIPMRGSLEKVIEENERLRHLVDDSGAVPPNPRVTLPAGSVLPYPSGVEDPFFLDDFSWEIPEPQELEGVQLDGQTIHALFEHFSHHYFRHLPILDLRISIDSFRTQSPLLFWTLLLVASSRHPLHSAHFKSLQAPLKRMLSEYLPCSIRSIWTIQALLLLCLWPFPVKNQLDDPSWEYCGIAVAAALKMGLDGSPANWGVAIQPTTDELTCRLKTWLGCFAVSTNVAACLSLPPPMGSVSVAHLMPGICNRIRSSLPDKFVAQLDIQAYSIRATSVLSSQTSHLNQRSFIELLESDLDAVEARMPSPISPILQVGILAARLRLYSLPLLSRTSPRAIEGYSDTVSKTFWYKGFHMAIQLTTVFADSIRPDRINEVYSANERINAFFPKHYFQDFVMAGMYFINLLVIDKRISAADKLLAQNHIKKVYETLMAQSNEDRDEASRAAKAIDFLSRHVEAQSASLDLQESTTEKWPLNIINSGMRMAGQVRSKIGGSEHSPESELPPPFQGGTRLPLWEDDPFEWNTWLAATAFATFHFRAGVAVAAKAKIAYRAEASTLYWLFELNTAILVDKLILGKVFHFAFLNSANTVLFASKLIVAMESLKIDLTKGLPEPLCQIVTPIGMLGYGFNVADLEYGLQSSLQIDAPTAIVLDSGSTDSGPAKLALGSMTCPRSAYERDLRQLICIVQNYHVPLLISSAGGDGSDAHVNEFLDIISEILESSHPGERNSMKVLTVYSETSREWMMQNLKAGKVSGCGPCVPALTVQDIEATPTLVGQIGSEPLVQAMSAHPDFDILIAGRAYDPSPYVAFCAFHAFKKSYNRILNLDPTTLGGFTHMGKLMECGGSCATPKCAASMAVIYRDGSFDIRPLAPGSRCTPTSVAAHALYENSQPDKLCGPGGYLDLTTAAYFVRSDGITVRTGGAVFKSSKTDGLPYTIKFEGAKVTGYRTIFMGSFCDPILIQQLPSLLARVKAYVAQQHTHVQEAWSLDFHVYGFDPKRPREFLGGVFLVGETLAETQALATSVASCARVACVHAPYEGQKATSGNFGMGIGGKLEIETGVCTEFSLYHLVELQAGQEEAMEIRHLKKSEGHEGVVEKFIRWEMRLLGNGPRLDKTCSQLPKEGNRVHEELQKSPAANPSVEEPESLSGCSSLGDVATVIRSKNAGPFETTLDVIFDNAAVYEQIKGSGLLAPERIADLYDLRVEDIVWSGFFDPALAFKATIPQRRDGKPQSSGGFMESDVHGSQNHLPLMNLPLGIYI